MHFIVARSERGVGEAKGVIKARRFEIARDYAVNSIIVLGIAQVDFIGGYSDYRACILRPGVKWNEGVFRAI
jgi:hypothetical protein